MPLPEYFWIEEPPALTPLYQIIGDGPKLFHIPYRAPSRYFSFWISQGKPVYFEMTAHDYTVKCILAVAFDKPNLTAEVGYMPVDDPTFLALMKFHDGYHCLGVRDMRLEQSRYLDRYHIHPLETPRLLDHPRAGNLRAAMRDLHQKLLKEGPPPLSSGR